GGAKRARWIVDHPVTLYLCIAYLVFALLMTMAARFPDFGALLPHWLYEIFKHNDKTFLAPYRFLHFVVVAIMIVRFVPKDWSGLEWRVFDPLVVCGQQSLAVFCVGVFLSFVGHFLLIMSSGSLLSQIFVSVSGIAVMTLVAYYISWSKRQDKPLPKPALAKAP
ncbi:MAG: OpgC domain-containing protein, partial [Bradyrhizobium sp.]|uniref:OpgC domain-containing protein n=1 Tax=Bradyrhizobium sp. TaxID=376 RepID=UPI00272F8EE5